VTSKVPKVASKVVKNTSKYVVTEYGKKQCESGSRPLTAAECKEFQGSDTKGVIFYEPQPVCAYKKGCVYPKKAFIDPSTRTWDGLHKANTLPPGCINQSQLGQQGFIFFSAPPKWRGNGYPNGQLVCMKN